MGLGMKVLARKKRFVPASIAREMFARLKMVSSKKPSLAASWRAHTGIFLQRREIGVKPDCHRAGSDCGCVTQLIHLV